MTHEASVALKVNMAESVALEFTSHGTSPEFSLSHRYPDGSGSGQADQHATVSESVTFGTSEEWCFQSSAAEDATHHKLWSLAGAVSFDRVKALVVENLDATNALILAPAAVEGWNKLLTGSTVVIPPLSTAAFISKGVGWEVTALLRKVTLVPAAGTVAFKMYVVGVKT